MLLSTCLTCTRYFLRKSLFDAKITALFRSILSTRGREAGQTIQRPSGGSPHRFLHPGLLDLRGGALSPEVGQDPDHAASRDALQARSEKSGDDQSREATHGERHLQEPLPELHDDNGCSPKEAGAHEHNAQHQA